MKRLIFTPIPLLMSLLLAGCQEQIAPELSNPGATSSGGSSTTPTVSSTLKNFSVELNGLNAQGEHPNGMLIHKANEIFSEKCEVKNVIDTPDSITAARDISCLIEAEEFALYFNGVSMKATSGPETCDFIDVKPFTFWRYMPGVSGRYSYDGTNVTITPRRVMFYSCDDNTKQFNQAAAVSGSIGGVTHGAGINVGNLCDKFVNIDTGETVIAANIPSVKLKQDELCSFNFKDSNQKEYKCDEGSTFITKVDITSTPILDTNGTVVGASAPVFRTSPAEEFKCGGTAVACKSGPGVEYVGESAYQLGFRSRINPIPRTGGLSDLVLEAPFKKQYFSNKYISNFMYQQSGNFSFSVPSTFISGLYNPTRIEDYSKNRDYVTLPAVQEKDANNMDIVNLAEDAFRGGMASAVQKYNSKYITHPVYTFTCFDKSLDIKARIRVSVREWDRTFAKTSTTLRQVSDLHITNPLDRRLHANGVQSHDDGQQYLPDADWNDIPSWDDFFEICDTGAGLGDPAECGLINGGTTGPGLLDPTDRRSPASFPGESL